MIPGLNGFSVDPLATVPAAFDASVPNPLSVLLATPDPRFRYLLIATPFDPASGSEVTVYLADRSFATRPADTPANQFFAGRLTSVLNWQVTLFDGAEPAGGSPPAFGDIRVANADGGLDSWTGYEWDGRAVEIRVGGLDFTFDEFETVFRGTAADLVADETELAITIRDRAIDLSDPLQQTLYAGTGGLEGGEDIEGQAKPLAFGRVRNAAPVAVDRTYLIYQVHDGAVDAIDGVRDRGIGLTAGGDTGDIYAASPAPGGYVTDLSRGLFRLGSSPAGAVTADIRGDSTGGYVDTTAAIARRIVTTRLGARNLADPAELAVPSFAAVDAALPGAIGLYIAGARPTAAELLNRLMAAAAGFWTFTRDGALTVGVVQAPTGATRTITDSDIVSGQIERVSVAVPSHRRRLGYARLHTVQGAEELASGVSDSDRDYFANEYRFTVVEDAALRTRNALARDVEFLSLLDGRTAAEAEAARQQALYGVRRERFRVMLARPRFRYFPNHTVRLQGVGRFGLSEGRDFVVVGMAEDLSRNETVLELFG